MEQGFLRALRSAGLDVLTAEQAGMRGRRDDEHLAFAAAQQRVIFSFNVGDFFRLHTEYLRSGTRHSGLVVAAQQRYSIGEQSRRLIQLCQVLSAQDMVDRVEFLGSWEPL
jgi:hypothetical protein